TRKFSRPWSPSTSSRAATGSFHGGGTRGRLPRQLGRRRTPPRPRCRLRRRLRHRAVESSRQRSARRLLFCGAQAQEQRRLARGSKGRHRFLGAEQKARSRQFHRRRARDGGGAKELPVLQRWPAQELRVVHVRVRDDFFRLPAASSLSREEELAYGRLRRRHHHRLRHGGHLRRQLRWAEEKQRGIFHSLGRLRHSLEEAMLGVVGCTFQHSLAARRLTTSNRGGGATSLLIASCRSPTRLSIINARRWRSARDNDGRTRGILGLVFVVGRCWRRAELHRRRCFLHHRG
ncbi:No apical meristem (NAM) protein, partial [Musa troglodytarum]